MHLTGQNGDDTSIQGRKLHQWELLGPQEELSNRELIQSCHSKLKAYLLQVMRE